MSVIAFLSDYGLEDEFVGVCHGVIVSICPQARIIDLTHGVPRQDVRAGALILRDSLRYLPTGVHLAVVDPGVGSARRALALRSADGRLLVGPDNGLLMPAALAAGGVAEAVDIASSRYRLAPVSATFHGRDVFAPVAAHLAAGVALPDVGERIDPGELIGLDLPAALVDGGALVAHALRIDRFGNVQLDAGAEALGAAGLDTDGAISIELDSGGSFLARLGRAFADVARGEVVVYPDSAGLLAVAVNEGDAAARLGIGIDDTLRIRPA